MSDLASRRLDIDALRALRAIRQHGGITRAAAALGLTQSAVSHKVKRLEASLDCEILNRRAGAALFTEAGEDLLDYAARILALHDEALLSLTRTDLAGRIQLGLTEDTTCTDLSRILGRFRRLHPQVSVRVRVRMSLTLREMLERGELDAAIVQVFSHEVRPTDQVLFREGLHWVKASGLVLPDSGPVPFLSFDEACFYRRWALDIGQDEGALLETVFECASAAGIVAAVQAGLGVALLSDRHIRPGMEVVRGRLPPPGERFCGALPPPPGLAYVIRRARKARNPALDSLVGISGAEVTRTGGLSLAV